MKLLLAGLLLQQTVLTTAALNCQNGYVPYDNRDGYCVKAYQTKLTRNAAAAQCLTDGGYLIDVVNAFSNAEVLGLGKTAQQWLGVKCTVDGDGSKCTHDDPSNNKYTNFAPGGFPLTTAPFGQCVYMNGSDTDAGKWYSDSCDEDLKAFACEYRPLTPPDCPKNCRDIRNGLVYHRTIPAPGNVSSRNYPKHYNQLDCGDYILYTYSNMRIQLMFTDFDTGDWDDVIVFDGCGPNANFTRYSGSLVPFNITSTGNTLLLTFQSVQQYPQRGFFGTFFGF